MNKTQIFYHIFLENNWFEIVSEQVDVLLKSKLLNNSTLNVGVVYSNFNELEINKKKLSIIFEKIKNINILYFDSTTSCGECTTLAELKNFCDISTDEFYVLYIHTKGVTQFNSPREKPVKSWREMMEFFLIEKWEDCVNKLSEGFDCCGINYQDHAANINNQNKLIKIFNGNFFWSRSSYIKKLDKNLLFEHRHSSENWISSQNPKVHSFYDTPKTIDLYYQIDINYK